ncbi:hypothetical protein J2129_001331 [Methanofollis sp. W23]|nr:hypothetical protein [Methanofollis sp. W23]
MPGGHPRTLPPSQKIAIECGEESLPLSLCTHASIHTFPHPRAGGAALGPRMKMEAGRRAMIVKTGCGPSPIFIRGGDRGGRHAPRVEDKVQNFWKEAFRFEEMFTQRELLDMLIMKTIMILRGVWTRAPPSKQDITWEHHRMVPPAYPPRRGSSGSPRREMTVNVLRLRAGTPDRCAFPHPRAWGSTP